MARHHAMDPQEMIRRKRAGETHAQIAKAAGLTVSGVQQALQSAGYTKPYTSHREALPWKVKKEHAAVIVAKNLRVLSHLAQGNRLHKVETQHQWLANTAINWANEILDANQDVDYDPDAPPSEFSSKGGFFLKEADPENWHLKRLMQRVIATQTRRI